MIESLFRASKNIHGLEWDLHKTNLCSKQTLPFLAQIKLLCYVKQGSEKCAIVLPLKTPFLLASTEFSVSVTLFLKDWHNNKYTLKLGL